jgi:hypothetical protein
MNQTFGGILGILTIGAAGAIVYTVLKNPTGVAALFTGIDGLLRSSYNASLGKTS